MLNEVIQHQIARRNEMFSGALYEYYERAYPQTRQALENLFPEFRAHLQGRVKDRVSITNKLNKRAFAVAADACHIKTLAEAGQHIKDGHGFTFVLNDVSRPHMMQIRDGVLRAIRSGNLEVLVIKNYRGADQDTLPYFSDVDIDQVRMATENRRLQLPPSMRPPQVLVIDGSGIVKPSGYTTTQMRIRLRNPESGEFDLPIVDLHICGENVYRFYRGADHLVYDIREGKDIYKGNSYVRSRFEPEVRPLLDAIEAMPEAQFRCFTEYRGKTYAYLRQLESGQSEAQPPELPPELPSVCHLDNLTRLSELQQRLLQEAQVRVAKHGLKKGVTKKKPAPSRGPSR